MAAGWQRGRSPTVDVKCICLCLTDCWRLLLSATFAVCCFTFLSLSVQPRCVYFSLSLSNKKGRNHTRQELISQAANSRSRWSIFSFSFQNERTKWKLWPYMWSSAEQSSWDCFQLRAFHFVSVISQLLFYFIYSSSDLHTFTSLSLHGAPLHRPVSSQRVAWSSSVSRFCSSGLVSLVSSS